MAQVIHTTPGQLAGKIRARNRAAKKMSFRALQSAAHKSRAIIVRKTPVDQGQLKNSWRVRKSMGSGIGSGSIAAVLGNDAPHAGIVEEGARPHPVSQEGIAALHAWVWRNRKSFGMVAKSGRAQGGDAKKKAALGIAYAIARKISKEGQKGTFFVRKSLPELQEVVAKEVTVAMVRLSNRKQGKSPKA